MWSLPAFVALCLLFYALPAVLHAMRERWSVVPLYVFLGFVATAMVFITDTGAYFEIGEFRFLVGSTVFFVSLLLSIFIIYTFDSVRAARIAITFALAVTVVAPLLRGYLYSEGANFGLDESAFLEPAPMRVYVASTLSMALSFILLVILWQSLRNREKRLPLAAQIFLTLFVTLQFDALVFVTGAFAETEDYGAILSGHIFNRIFIAVAASPVLAFYFSWRLSQSAVQLPRREIFAILHSSQRTEADLGEARREIELRKQVEAALRESEERYKAVFYHSPVGILHFDNAGVVQECNDRLAQIIGVGPERLCGLNMLEALRDEEMRAAVSKALDSGIGYFNNYYRTITSDRLLWLRCQFRALYNASGRQIGGVGIFDDQTEQKAVQETLLQNEERVRTLLAALPVGVMIVDAVTDQVVDANPAALDMVQMDLEALREKTIDQMVDGNTTLPRGVSQETTIRSHPSAALPVLRTVVDVELSRKAHRIEILMDNTERKKAEEALQRRDAILEAVNFSAQRFLESHNPEKQIPDVLKRLGRATAVSRVYIFKNYTDENNVIRMNQQWEWCATGVAAQIDNPDLHGLAYSEAGFDRWAEILADGQALYGDVEDFPEGERQMLEPQGIISIVVTPILVGERFYGFIGFDECSTPRKWTSVEVEALHGAGRALGLALARSDAENAVRRSEEQLDLALRGAALGTWNWHLDTNRVDFNEGWAEMLGYRLDEVESHVDTWKNALHPNDIAQTVGALRLHLEGESEKYESEHRLKTKSGDWIWVLDRGRIVERDSEGNAVRMAGTHLDITERKKMDAALTAAREKEKETESRIEETLLRGHVPRHIDGAETAALSVPSEHIDGDFYDFFQHGPHCFDILVGDVMGKGIQAALVGAGAKSHFLRALSALPRKNGSPRPASVHDIVAPVHSELAPQ
ncbi:MAG: PAS domain S-box protein, partial [Candidatus Sumerlaeota bacterium]